MAGQGSDNRRRKAENKSGGQVAEVPAPMTVLENVPKRPPEHDRERAECHLDARFHNRPEKELHGMAVEAGNPVAVQPKQRSDQEINPVGYIDQNEQIT